MSPSTAKGVQVATETLSYCTSCKMDLNHIIVAMKGDKIARVQCLTCKKEHNYKAPKGVTEPPKKKKKKEAAEPAGNPIEMEWEKLMSDHREAPLKPYNTKGNFLLGDKISHPTFGDGIIGKLIYPNKVEVIFRHDLKVLIHAGVLRA